MNESRLSAYVAKSKAYRDSPKGRRQYDEALRYFAGDAYYATAVIVMAATRIVTWERIQQIVDALQARRVAA